MICERTPQNRIGDFNTAGQTHIDVLGRRVALDFTPCNLGGQRAWFLCPSCGRRCGVLYPLKCRVCLGLRYASELKGVQDRDYQQAFKVRRSLGQTTGGLEQPFPPKPRLMRWHTYLRIRLEAQAREARILSRLAAVLPHGHIQSDG